MPVNRSDSVQVEAMGDPLSFAADSADKVRGLVVEAKAALAHLYKLVLPRLPQERTLHELAETFLVKKTTAVEVLKRNSRIYGAFLALQVMMGNGFELNYEEVVRMLPKDKDGALVDLTPFVERAKECATGLVEFAEANKKKKPKKDAPSTSAQTHVPSV